MGINILSEMSKVDPSRRRLSRGLGWVIPVNWTTASGSLGSPYTEQSATYTLFAANATSYSVVSGSLPTGLTLNTTTGVISGTVGAGAVANYTTTTVNFTIRAANSSSNSDRAFSIFVQSRYVGYSCFTGNEGATLSGTAPSGVFNRVDFSSYGTPNGSCGAFTIGGCNSASSNAYNPTPTASFSIGADNGTWGDPCSGTAKRMYIQMSYGPF